MPYSFRKFSMALHIVIDTIYFDLNRTDIINFYLLEVVGRVSDPQLQVDKNVNSMLQR